LLEGDDRVVAAWLFGSLGRGDGDALSDLDLWVVVDDEHIGEIVAARREYVAGPGEPLLIEEAPQNGPAGGGYLLALYEGKAGPHQVDWYWQARSDARVPADAQVLFDKAGIPPAPARPPLADRERAEAAANQAAFFWAMVNIIAKKIARGHSWAALRMLCAIRVSLDEVKWLVDPSNEQPDYSDKRPGLPPVQPTEQLALLSRMAHEMEALSPQLMALGCEAPAEAMQAIYTFIDLVEESFRS
jgi:hypothetical protein